MRNGFLLSPQRIVYGITFVLLTAIVTIMPLKGLAFPLTPNPQVTPGDICNRSNPDYKQDRYDEKIPYCQRNVASSTKKSIYRVYGIPDHCTGRFTIDHLIPLSIGGSNSVRNLWPEHKFVKATRQALEEQLYKKIAGGRITQKAAIDQILNEKFNPPRPDSQGNDCDHLDLQPDWLAIEELAQNENLTN